MTTFHKAVKSESKLRLALIGPAGSGKTYTSLLLASRIAMVSGGGVALVDTEHGSASKYADRWPFDTLSLGSFSPQVYIDAIHAAEKAQYAVLILDSLSHAWAGPGGALELVDQAKARMKNPNSYTAWRDVTPLHNRLVDSILGANLHIIATMRSKMDYVQEQGPDGKAVIRKVGMQAIQRDGIEYEFDVVGDLDTNLNLLVTKTRCPLLTNKTFHEPNEGFADILLEWLKGEPLAQGSAGAPEPEVADRHHPMTREELARAALKLGYKRSDQRVEQALGMTVDTWVKLGKPLEDAHLALEQYAAQNPASAGGVA